jgi:hypothetical protein
MEVQGILFFGKGGRLLPAAALEGGVQYFEKKVGLGGGGPDLHPGPT